MQWRSFVWSVVLPLVILTAGCSYSTRLKYDPIAGGPKNQSATITLEVRDARPPQDGGGDKSQVGRVRGGYGNPFAVRESGPERVSTLVGEALTDALRQAGIGTRGGGNRKLVAEITSFWIDGFLGYKSTIAATCSLEDDRGKVLWTRSITGAHGGALVFRGVGGFVSDVFRKALAEFATRAKDEFNSPDFQKNVF